MTFQILPPFGVTGAGAKTPKSTMNISGATEAYVDWLVEAFEAVHADQAAEVGGELIDVLSNIWIVKAFSTRARERARFAHLLGTEESRDVRAKERLGVASNVIWKQGRPNCTR